MAATPQLVKAQDLAPQAFGGAALHAEMSSKVDDLVYDVHHLLACDTHAINLEAFEKAPEETLRELTSFGVKGLINKLFQLETEPSSAGPVAHLPPSVTILPRAKPIPEAKKETKWEKFAKEKGIQKKKRARMIWDEQTNEWRPRWGYKRANGGIEDMPVVELKPGDDPYEDPWTKAREAKKQRVAKNLEQQRKNMERGEIKPSFGLPVDLPAGKKEKMDKKKAMKKGKAGGKAALEVAQSSTASLGRFDNKLPDEPVRVVKKPKVILPVADKGTLDKESDKMKALAAKILKPPSDKSKKAPVNIDALEPPRDGYGRKKGRGHKRKAGK